MEGCGDGSWDNKRYFTCENKHAVFIVLSKLKPDQRFSQRPKGNNRKIGNLFVMVFCKFSSRCCSLLTEVFTGMAAVCTYCIDYDFTVKS